MKNYDLVFTCAYKTIPMQNAIDYSAKTRRILQKVVYLLQECGLDFGYHYGWYIYGPYSPELSEDWIKWLPLKNFVKLDEKYLNVIDKLNKLFVEYPTVDYLHWVELTASLHYVGSSSLLFNLVSKYSKQDIKFVFDLLKKHGLMHSNEESKIEEEMEVQSGKKENIKYYLAYLYLTAKTDISKNVVIKLAKLLDFSADDILEISKQIDLYSIKLD